MSQLSYQEAINYLQQLTKFGFNFGLGRITELMRRIGDPHKKLNVVHIGGTNGKGSTLAMLGAILQSAGYRTGTFTSPHLHSYTERYRINGRKIQPGRVAGLINALRPHLDAMVKEGFEHPTEFEVSTALAFQYFYEEKVDVLLLEVGLGGLIDSTNVVDPLVAVITNVAMDHMNYLGRTIKEIAAVKAGIIKEGVPAVTASRNKEALAVIEKTCRDKKSSLIQVGRDVTWRVLNTSLRGQRFDVYGTRGIYKNLEIPLIGSHQLVNAATALAVVEVLAGEGWEIPLEAARSGLAKTYWPARLEVVRKSPVVLIDGAHNLHGAKSLRQALEQFFPGKRLVLVMGMLGDKERAKVAAELAPLADVAIITKPSNPRANDWRQLAGEASKYAGRVRVIKSIPAAVQAGLEEAGPDDLVCITGSLYMVAEAREALLGDRSDW